MKSLCLRLSFLVLFNPFAVFSFFSPTDLTLAQTVEKKSTAPLFLKYQNHDGDYLIFYDADGDILYLRYRRDKWDYSHDRERDFLRRGITYELRVVNLEKLSEGELPKGVMGADLPAPSRTRKIRRIRSVFKAEWGGVSDSALRDLRY